MRKKVALLVAGALTMGAMGAVSLTANAGEVKPLLINAKARNYYYRNIPARLVPGDYKFTFENRTPAKHHELIFLKHKTDHTTKEILNMPEEKARKKVKVIGVTFANPGKEGKPFEANLDPGRYFAVCFVQNDDNAPPHWVNGMVDNVKVLPAN